MPGQVMWDLWWTKWHWGRFAPSTSVSPANPHCTVCSIIIIDHPGLVQLADVPSGLSLTPPRGGKTPRSKHDKWYRGKGGKSEWVTENAYSILKAWKAHEKFPTNHRHKNATVVIPDVERKNMSFRNIIVIVLGRCQDGMYKFGTKKVR
jgi:hypothetical protein